MGGEHGMPKDIESELDAFYSSTKEVKMHYDAMYNHRAYGFLSSLFMTPTRTFSKLDIIYKLFPKITTFSMMRVPLTTLTFMYIKSVIDPPNIEEEKDDHKEDAIKGGKIREIRLIDPKTDAMSIDATIQAEKRCLAQLQWTIHSEDGVSLVLKYSEHPVIIKEPTPPPLEQKEEEKKEEKEKVPVKKKRKLKKRRPKTNNDDKKEPAKNDTKEKANNDKTEQQK